MKSLIIGSGFGGIAAALRLRAKGHNVKLIEKHKDLGGRARVFKKNGFIYDGGPTVITVGPPSKINPFFLNTLALPPRSLCFSIKVTLCFFALNLNAAAIPPKPEPITTEFISYNLYYFLKK